jgi:hypothetical protein
MNMMSGFRASLDRIQIGCYVETERISPGRLQGSEFGDISGSGNDLVTSIEDLKGQFSSEARGATSDEPHTRSHSIREVKREANAQIAKASNTAE